MQPETYGDRNRLLLELGFQSYKDYLDSPLWESIRGKLLRHSPQCCCGRRATQVHHSRYTFTNLSGLSTDDLRAICHRCHKYLEFRPDGTKRPHHEVQALEQSLGNHPPTKKGKRGKAKPTQLPQRTKGIPPKKQRNHPGGELEVILDGVQQVVRITLLHGQVHIKRITPKRHRTRFTGPDRPTPPPVIAHKNQFPSDCESSVTMLDMLRRVKTKHSV